MKSHYSNKSMGSTYWNRKHNITVEATSSKDAIKKISKKIKDRAKEAQAAKKPKEEKASSINK